MDTLPYPQDAYDKKRKYGLNKSDYNDERSS
jgi:hypothetical protein